MRLAIVGTGDMANQHAKAFQQIEGVSIVASAEIDADRRQAFARKFDIPRSFSSVERLIEWGEFDAACNVTPDAVHHSTTLPLLRAGKHVLCEKPLATDHAHAAEMAGAAEAAGVIHMVNLTYRNVAALQRAKQLIASGGIGEIRHLEAAYLQSWLSQPAWGDWRSEPRWLWRLSTAHGSHGVLGDVGIHILDFASYAAGLDVTSVCARLQTFDKAPGGRIGGYTLDANDSFALSAVLENGALAAVHASRFASGHMNDLSLRIFGTNGGIEISNAGRLGTMRTCLGADMTTATWTKAEPDPVPTNFQRFAEAVRTGGRADPDFHHAAKLQAVLDAALVSGARGQAVTIGA